MFKIPEKINLTPDIVLPNGPIWEIEGRTLHPELETKWWVHRLEKAPNMLLTAALLKRSNKIEGLHFNTAGFWTLHENDIWIASEAAAGQNLYLEPTPRMSWSEALDVWRPLTEAVLRAHKRGVIVGNLSLFSIWFDPHLRRLCSLNPGCWIADRYPLEVINYLPPEFSTDGMIKEGLDRKPTFQSDVWSLAHLLVHLVTKSESSFDGVPGFAIDGLKRALAQSPKDRSESVSELLKVTTPPRLREGQHTEGTHSDLYFGKVGSIEHLESEKFGKGIKFFLHYPNADDEGNYTGSERVGTFFYEGKDEQVFDSIKSIWEGAEVNLLQAKEIFNKAGERFLSASNSTLPVLEPHWLVSVTDILKAEGCVSRYFVDLRDMGAPSRPLVFGSLLHGMLDDLSHANVSFEDAYFPRLNNMRIGLLAAGLDDSDLPAFEAQARRHFSQIAGFARGRNISDTSRNGWTGEHVEVTRYSTTYGLEGRIDLVTEDAKVGLQIVELKSGAERDEHLSQLRCYRLLWDGVAERGDLPIIGYLLYSKSGILRSAPFDDPDRERRILRARNGLLSAHRAQFDPHVDRPLPHFMGEPLNCRAPACRWRKDRCAKQSVLCGLDPALSPEDASKRSGPLKGHSTDVIAASWKHWHHFSRLLELEFWEQGEQLGRVVNKNSIWDRIQSMDAVDGVKLSSVHENNVVFEGAFGKPFAIGTLLLAHTGDLERDHILRGRVTAIEVNRITISAMGAPNAPSLSKEGWILDKLPTRIGYRAAQRSLYRFLKRGDNALFRIIYSPESDKAKALCHALPTKNKPDAFKRSIPDLGEGYTLNEKQIDAIHLALESPKAAIIQGPPGTGKTTVISHIVGELVDSGKRVLLSAQTNTAVDKMLESLLSLGIHDFLRVGDSKRSPALKLALEEKELDSDFFFSRNLGRKTPSLDALGTRLKYTQVIACTTHSSGSDNVISFLQHHVQDIPFDVVIIDEATQISEPMALGTIALGERFVIVGDHRQLPPIVQNEGATSAANAESVVAFLDIEGPIEDKNQLGIFEQARSPEESLEKKMGLSGLDTSLFERLVERGIPYVMLEEQYRMNVDIMAFSSRWFYDEKLSAHPMVAHRQLPLSPQNLSKGLSTILDPNNAVVFVNVEGQDEGRKNPIEAHALIETIGALVASSETDIDVGVISPFRAQCHLLRTELAKQLPRVSNIAIDTVERFQGAERDVILVSWVKSKSPGEFLADEKRLNVTLTRAKKKLILFGNYKCLILNPMYRDLLEQEQTIRVNWSDL